MNEPSASPYRKKFSSRYELSRELQILDYLGQRRAPVPPIVMSHTELAYLDMHHGGPNLKTWLTSEPLTLHHITDALSQAIQALITTAEFGVWHFDVALRNFVIQNQIHRQTVWLIDFGNAVCPHFTLQKPLWMRPQDDQHRALQDALAKDWQHFYERHQLGLPHDWRDSFDVSTELYQDDWTSHLSVEALPQKWCVIAHACGQMLLTATRIQPGHLAAWVSDFETLLNLEEDAVAQKKLVQLAHDLLKGTSHPSLFDHEQTPRPRAITADAPAIHIAPAPHHHYQWPHFWYLGVAGVLIALGWWVIDIAYEVHDQPLSDLSAGILTGVGFISVVGLLGLMDKVRRVRWLQGGLWAHTLGQSLMVFELWLWDMKLETLGVLATAPMCALLVLLWIRTKPPS